MSEFSNSDMHNNSEDLNKHLFIETYGCQMNEHDSETIAGMLQEKGCSEVPDRRDSDITIINTCSIRENADNRFIGTLGQQKKRKEREKGNRETHQAKKK